MKYAIQSDSGQWWTGAGWGAKEARATYTDGKEPSKLYVDDDDVLSLYYDPEYGSYFEDDGDVEPKASLTPVK